MGHKVNKPIKVKISPELESVLTLFTDKFKKTGLANIFCSASMPEGKIASLAKYKEADLVNFSKKHFVRVYPAGTRFDSSNFSPVNVWPYGC